jgi:hypothetical protein
VEYKIGDLLIMEKSEFKKLFGEVAHKHGFQFLYGVWMKESPEVILMLELQKSNFSVEYYLNIKIFIHGIFQLQHIKNKKLSTECKESFFRRCPTEYGSCLDLENSLTSNERKNMIESLFTNFIDSFSDKALNIMRIYKLVDDSQLLLFPNVKIELDQLLAKKQDQV